MLVGFRPVVINKYGTMDTREDISKILPGRLVKGHNTRFREDSLGPRPGLSIAIRVPFTVQPLVIITACPMAAGTNGVAYAQALGADGGTPPFTWSITQGVLPTGLSLGASTGLISGTPSAAGTFVFEITVTDGTRTTTKSCSIVVS